MDFTTILPLYQQHEADLLAAAQRVLASGYAILGPEVETLEERLAEFCAVRHCITCASGTDALVMALMALGVGPGHEVITVPFTWISTVQAIETVGATPIFIDIEADAFTLDPALLSAAITERTRAIMPVSLFGQMADMDGIAAVAAAHDLPVIEDGAQSFGASRNGRASCAASIIGCTSFYPSKPLGCFGDGGALFTDDDEQAERLRSIRVHGADQHGLHVRRGINGRFDAVQAALMLTVLPGFAERLAARRRIGQRYNERLDGLSGLRPAVTLPGNEHIYAQYTLRVRQRDAFCKRLADDGIPYRVYYERGAHQQPHYLRLGYQAGSLPVTEAACREVLSLPMHPWLGEDEQDQVCAALAAVSSTLSPISLEEAS